jgi:hypothetical protein
LSLFKTGKDINEILDMPYHYSLQLLNEETKPVKKKSLIEAFGG